MHHRSCHGDFVQLLDLHQEGPAFHVQLQVPPATKAMLDPLWASFLAEATKAGGSS
jgi:hypothetical protein